MANLFKNIGKGIGYFFLFPGLIIAIAIYSVFGLLVFIFQLFKLIFLFFTGRNLFSDLPEDIELKALLDNSDTSTEEQKSDSQQPQYVYQTAEYVAPAYDKKEEENKAESPKAEEPQVAAEPPEEKPSEGGEQQ